MAASPAVNSDKAWVTLITNEAYLPGLLTLNHSLRAVRSAYPLVALYTSSVPSSCLAALSHRGIPSLPVHYIAPKSGKKYLEDARFNDCWTKLVAFSLTQFSRVVQLDSDMLPLRNMDELMDLALDPVSLSESGSESSKRVFASGHACVCNPLKKPHYPSTWIRDNCAFTHQHANPDQAQVEGADPARSLGDLNSGLLVINPSAKLFQQILQHMDAHGETYTFPDQDLLADLYRGRWVPLPYVYNALKTMRSPDVHGAIWRDAEVKNVHYILSPKPWKELDEQGQWKGGSEIDGWWVDANRRRLQEEQEEGISD
ncbi:glycosyl transferase family protein [Metarhizium album ARSEF 1941]|uniref:Glycosyl transferase family protein n=1 Tax=Metarhizium album (strain ARSEF 1941) TaxID=1081103 RepID=A0A0B2WZU9_METAS|nr:glycosyl transferase family protein [Metarhizium album ARSEF 1941]KHN98962.1 glycosyl transferase family protein [Metarhizium album ARSEF 1941]